MRGRSRAAMKALRRKYRLGEFARTPRKVSAQRGFGARRAARRATKRSGRKSSQASSFNNPNNPANLAVQRLQTRPDVTLTRTGPSDALESGDRDSRGGRYEN